VTALQAVGDGKIMSSRSKALAYLRSLPTAEADELCDMLFDDAITCHAVQQIAVHRCHHIDGYCQAHGLDFTDVEHRVLKALDVVSCVVE
jgi:hypothetical protein